MSAKDDQPYQWPDTSGCLTAHVLRDFTSWLFPKMDLEWESPGVVRRKPSKQPKRAQKPFQFRKSKGWLNLQADVRPLAAYVLAKGRPWSDRKPFMPKRKKGPAFVSDLQALHDYLVELLAKKKAEQSKKPASSS